MRNHEWLIETPGQQERRLLALVGEEKLRMVLHVMLTPLDRQRSFCAAVSTRSRKPKLDRLTHSVPDARSIADELAARGVTLALGQSRYDPADPMGKMFFNILATFAEFEAT